MVFPIESAVVKGIEYLALSDAVDEVEPGVFMGATECVAVYGDHCLVWSLPETVTAPE